MPYYRCTFVTDEGSYTDKILYSDSRNDLKESYRSSDSKLLYIRRLYFQDISLGKFFKKKISSNEFLQFNQKLIILLKSGTSFIRALEVIIDNTERGTLKEILLKAETDIKNGIQISDAFSSRQIPFHKIYRASLLAGERSGNLEEILEKFNAYLEKITRIKRKTLSSLTYPVILFLFMITMVMLILLFAIPAFASFFANFEAKLPPITQSLIALSTSIKENVLMVVLVLAAIYLAIKLLEKYVQNMVIIDFIKTRLPFLGKIIVENAMVIFSRTLSILISGGIPIPESTTIAVETFANRYFALKVKDMPVNIKEGSLLSQVLAEVGIFPGIMVEVIRVGESSGNLVEVLDKNAQSLEDSMDVKINTIISLIEPILIIVLGLVIAFMLVAVYLPIFTTVRIIR